MSARRNLEFCSWPVTEAAGHPRMGCLLAYCGHSAALVALGISAMPKLRTSMPQTLQRRGVETTGHRRRPYPCRKRVIATPIAGPPARPTSYDFAQRENRKDRGKRPLESSAEPPAKTGIFRAVEVAGC